jgi:hypothetical protein
MPKLSLLDIVQDIMSDMSSDEVSSINESVESLQVAQIVKSTYFNIIDGRDWPHLYELYTLEPSGDSEKPTHMKLPESVIEIEWLKYNIKDSMSGKEVMKDMTYKSPKEFMNILNARDSLATYVKVVTDPTLIELNIYNDRAPTHYTSFDNEYIILDAFDEGVEDTLQASKTQAYGRVYPVWEMSDNFVPDLPAQSFSYLLNEAKSTCFLRLAQTADSKSEQHSLTQKRRMSRDAWRVVDTVGFPNYGRKGKK